MRKMSIWIYESFTSIQGSYNQGGQLFSFTNKEKK